MGGGDCDGSDGGGFGAEDAGAEGDWLPMMLGEERHLFRGPSAFGAYCEGDVLAYQLRRLLPRDFQGGGKGGGLLGFAEQDARGGVFLFEGWLQGGGVGDFRDIGAAGLLGGFQSDAAPAFGALEGGLGEVFFGAAGEDGCDAGDAKLGGLFDGPLHVVELEDGEEEVEGEGRVGFKLFVEREDVIRVAETVVISARWRKPLATMS